MKKSKKQTVMAVMASIAVLLLILVTSYSDSIVSIGKQYFNLGKEDSITLQDSLLIKNKQDLIKNVWQQQYEGWDDTLSNGTTVETTLIQEACYFTFSLQSDDKGKCWYVDCDEDSIYSFKWKLITADTIYIEPEKKDHFFKGKYKFEFKQENDTIQYLWIYKLFPSQPKFSAGRYCIFL